MIRSLLLHLRRRLLLHGFCHELARAALAGGGVLLILDAVRRGSGAELALMALSIGAAVVFIAAARTWCARPSLMQVALLLDDRAGTRDRLASGLAFETPATPLQASALAECETYVKTRFDGRRWIPWTVPRALPWLAAPLLSILMLRLWPEPGALTGAPSAARMPDPIAIRTATELERMASRLETKAKENRPGELQKVAEALKRSASHLRQEAAGTASSKATLLELSSLEELLRAAQEGNTLDTLGDALAKTDDGKDAGQALKKHDPKAPEKLEQLGKRLVEGKNKDQPMKQLEKALADAAAQLGDHSGVGSAASEAAAQARSGNASGAGEAMGKLGEAVREMQGSSGGGGSTEMQGMISKLQEMKSGQEGSKAEPATGSGNGEKSTGPGPLTADKASDGKKNGQPAVGILGSQGKPGSELDPGGKKTPFGTVSPGNSTQAGKQVQLAGSLGAGESIRAMIATTPGAESARAGYKPLYDAAQPAAEDALSQEPIPIGSRLFVIRYFEAIRPK